MTENISSKCKKIFHSSHNYAILYLRGRNALQKFHKYGKRFGILLILYICNSVFPIEIFNKKNNR